MNPGRLLIREGALFVKKNATEWSEITLFLFDHVIALVRKKDNGTMTLKKVFYSFYIVESAVRAGDCYLIRILR